MVVINSPSRLAEIMTCTSWSRWYQTLIRIVSCHKGQRCGRSCLPRGPKSARPSDLIWRVNPNRCIKGVAMRTISQSVQESLCVFNPNPESLTREFTEYTEFKQKNYNSRRLREIRCWELLVKALFPALCVLCGSFLQKP